MLELNSGQTWPWSPAHDECHHKLAVQHACALLKQLLLAMVPVCLQGHMTAFTLLFDLSHDQAAKPSLSTHTDCHCLLCKHGPSNRSPLASFRSLVQVSHAVSHTVPKEVGSGCQLTLTVLVAFEEELMGFFRFCHRPWFWGYPLVVFKNTSLTQTGMILSVIVLSVESVCSKDLAGLMQ